MHWPTPDPVAFSIFGLDVRWYGVLIASAVFLGFGIACRRAPSFGLKPDTVVDSLLIAIPLGVIGARLYYVLFHWDYYGGNLLRIFHIRGGGLAVHGALILGILGIWLYCRAKKEPFLSLLDLLTPCVALGQSIGRWGNFFNQEAHGGSTDLPWAIEVDGQFVHPTFLYESLWCFLLFIFLLWFSKKRSFDGQIFLLYGILYSLERFFVESLRTDSLMLFGLLKTAQAVSVTAIVLFVILYFVLRGRARKKISV